jgi:hypothetical protein
VSTVKPVAVDDRPGWKARFRLPRILGIQVAADAPTRGLVISNVSGTFQVHAWDVPSGRLRALTSRPTGTVSGLLGPDGRSVYYHDDADGNEIGHFARIPFEGGAPVRITPDLPRYPTFGLSVSGSGNRLGFVTASDGSYHVHLIEVGAGGALGSPQRIHTSGRLMIGPALSRWCDRGGGRYRGSPELPLGLGRQPGYGWKQVLGAVIGALAILAGEYLRRRLARR